MCVDDGLSNILVGLAGQISLGHVGFYAVGAYTAAILTLKGISFWIAFPLAGLRRSLLVRLPVRKRNLGITG